MAVTDTTLRRGVKVTVQVTTSPPYKITNREGVRIGSTLSNDKGVYLTNANFKVVGGKPIVEGRFNGYIDVDRLNISLGTGVAFDMATGVFTDGFDEIKTARMVQLYDGIIKVVIA